MDQPEQSRDRLYGVACVALGVAVLSPDSLLVRLIQTDTGTLLFWRGLLTALSLGLMVIARHGRESPAAAWRIGRPGLLAGALFGGSSICFTLSVLNTLVANTLIILATAPLWAAAFSRIFLKEQVTWRTWAAITGAITGIGITVGGSHDAPETFAAVRSGDVLALLTAFLIGGHWTTLRRVGASDKRPALALGGLLAAGLALPFAQPLAVPPLSSFYLAVLGLGVVPVAFALMAASTHYLPSAEVAMMLLLETVLGTLWVWLALGERPGPLTFVGGAIVLATLTAYFADQQRRGTAPA